MFILTLPLVYLSSLNQRLVFFLSKMRYTEWERRQSMNQIKIGRFVAECRRKANLTQLQLAEKLGITDKAVSKWERGVTMPDTSIMLELCDILGISVNELLSGEKINM